MPRFAHNSPVILAGNGAGAFMIGAVRGLVWLTGSLSVAVLLQSVLRLEVTAEIAALLAGFEGLVAASAPIVMPAVDLVLLSVDDALGSGAALHPHWPLVFLVVLLHLLPRLDATYGVARAASGVLWCLQAAGAVLGAVVVAAVLGAAPLLGDNLTANFLFLVFIMSELISNAWGDFGGAFAERAGEIETGEKRGEVTWRSIFAYASNGLFFLSAIFAGAIYYYVRSRGGISVDAIVVAALSYGILAALILVWAILRRPRAYPSLLRRGIFEAPITNIARAALLGAALFVSGTLPVEGSSARRAVRYVMAFATLVALPIAALVIGASFAIDWATGRQWEERPAPEPSALGIFFLGGAALLLGGTGLALA
jgi:hypothetical protein